MNAYECIVGYHHCVGVELQNEEWSVVTSAEGGIDVVVVGYDVI